MVRLFFVISRPGTPGLLGYTDAIGCVDSGAVFLVIGTLMSSRINRTLGTTIEASKVVAIKPNAKLATMGIKNWACVLVSVRRGNTPAIVVSEVSIMALNLSLTASLQAALSGSP